MNTKPIINVLGNFGVSFFTPLMGGTIADNIYPLIDLTVWQSVTVAFWSAVIYTGLAISREASVWRGKKSVQKE